MGSSEWRFCFARVWLIYGTFPFPFQEAFSSVRRRPKKELRKLQGRRMLEVVKILTFITNFISLNIKNLKIYMDVYFFLEYTNRSYGLN